MRKRGALSVALAAAVPLALMATIAFAASEGAPARGSRDSRPPGAPQHVRVMNVTDTTAALDWDAPNVDRKHTRAATYRMYRNNALVATTTSSRFTFRRLTCVTHYVVGVQAVGSNGNASPITTRSLTTDACRDRTPPTVRLVDPSFGATIRSGQPITAIATDGKGAKMVSGAVKSVAFGYCRPDACSWKNATTIGTATSSPYTVMWSSQPSDGSYALIARATDMAGNAADSSQLFVTVDNTPPDTTLSSHPAATTSLGSATFEFTSEFGATFACSLDSAAFADCASPTTYNALGSGVHTFQVRATDAAGNVDPTPASFTWTIATPDTTITTHPPALTNATGASFTFTSDLSGATFECKLDTGAYAACASSTSYSGLLDGTHTLLARAVFNGITDPTPATFTWTVDTGAPDTSLASHPGSVTSDSGATFTFSSEAGATFECKLDAAVYAACASPRAYTGLADGSHTFSVRAIDAAGNTDATPATFGWTVDTTPPLSTIACNGAPCAGPYPNSVHVSLVATDAGSGVARILYTLDGSEPSAVHGTPYLSAFDVLDSTTIRFRAYDAAGNEEPARQQTITILPPTPETAIAGHPSALTNDTSATFTFSSDTGVRFECRLDSELFDACDSPQTFARLADGSHAFEVRAVDASGTSDPTPASFVWTVDTAAPTVSIGSSPASPSNSAVAVLEFSSEPLATFRCRLDGSAFAPCTSPVSYPGLADGPHTFGVSATDAAGNTGPSADVSWTVDTTPPDTTLNQQPSSPTRSTSADFEFSSEPGATFACRLDDGPSLPCGSPLSFSGLADGSHTFSVGAIDAAGNPDPSPAAFTWTVDTTPPTVTLDSEPQSPTNATSARFTWHENEAVTGFECALDGDAFSPCSSGVDYTGLGEESHTFKVRAIADLAGNDGTATSFSWTVDTTPPTVVLDSAPADPTNATTATFTWHASELVTGFECSLDGGAFSPCASGDTHSGLADGSHTFSVRAVGDLAGNAGTTTSYSWTVDATPPAVTLDSAPSGPTTSTAASFSFHADEPVTGFSCRLDGGSFSPCVSPASYAGLADGAHTFEVKALADLVGNAGTTTSATWTVDTTAPATTITDSPANPSNVTAPSFSFAANESTTGFRCQLDGGGFSPCASPQSYSSLAEGAHTFQVMASSDLAGNPGTTASYTWTIDTTPPATVLESMPPSSTKSTAAAFTWHATELVTGFQCALDGGAFSPCLSGASYSSLGEGSHTFRVAAVADLAGNPGTVSSYSWSVDSTAPETSITSQPANPSKDASASFSFSSNNGGATFECRLDGGSWAACASPVSYGALVDGVHTFDVRATDAVGNTDPTPASFTWTVDTVAPVAVIDSGPANPANSASASFSFHAGEQATFECRLDGGSFSPCTSPSTYSSLSEGGHTFRVRATDAAGNAGPETVLAWSIDLTAPITTITSSPASPTNHTDAEIVFSSSETSSFRCRFDAGASVACVSPFSLSLLADGSHTVDVTATDAAGNTGPAASVSWTVDTVAPTTAITSHPSDPTNQISAAFAFSASENGAAFRCGLDGAGLSSCASPQNYSSLAEGTHTFAVAATDQAGNTGAKTTFTWTVDTSSPVPSITAHPSDPTNQTTASFSFTSTKEGTFECALDAGVFTPCTSPQAYSSLANGSHTFSVKTVDRAGNTGGPVSFTWHVDSTAPTVTFDSTPPDPSRSTTANFAFSASKAGSTFLCAQDGAVFAPCTSPVSLNGLADGSHTFAVKATDEAGNPSPATTFTWRVDTIPPVATVNSGPASPTNATSATFTFSASEPATFRCRLDGGPSGSCSSPVTYGPLADGAHSFQVEATDAAGNTASAAPFAWTIDTSAPTATITSAPSDPTNSTSAHFDFSSPDGGTSFKCKLDSDPYSSCSSPRSYTSLADGSHTFSVEATDDAGNTSTAVAFTWRVDTIPPSVTGTSGPAGTTNATAATFTFSSSEPGSTFECSLDSGAFSVCSPPQSYSGLAEGHHTFHVKATDAAGNTGPVDEYSWTVDLTPPAATIDAHPADPTKATGANFGFSSEPGAALECALDGSSFQPCTSPKSYSGLADGSHSFSVRATDAAGNTGAAVSFTWRVDTTAPTVSIGAHPDALTTSSSASLAFSSEPNATFACDLDGAGFRPCTSPQSYTALADGSHTFSVRATDAAGNTGSSASFTWTVDTTAPTVSIDIHPAPLTNHTDASFSFSSGDSSATFECAIDGSGFQHCTSPTNFNSLADGSHTFRVRSTDAAGNTGGPASFTWTVDTSAPTVSIDTHPNPLTASGSASFGFSSEAGARSSVPSTGADSSLAPARPATAASPTAATPSPSTRATRPATPAAARASPGRSTRRRRRWRSRTARPTRPTRPRPASRSRHRTAEASAATSTGPATSPALRRSPMAARSPSARTPSASPQPTRPATPAARRPSPGPLTRPRRRSRSTLTRIR